MRATFALLADTEAHNMVRKISWDFHQKYHTGILSLPPHVSLKQPFPMESLSALERYMDEFARSFEPFEVKLTELDVIPISHEDIEYGILWIDVQETEELRGLHNRLNEELNDEAYCVSGECTVTEFVRVGLRAGRTGWRSAGRDCRRAAGLLQPRQADGGAVSRQDAGG